jgi:hypothetical protein
MSVGLGWIASITAQRSREAVDSSAADRAQPLARLAFNGNGSSTYSNTATVTTQAR